MCVFHLFRKLLCCFIYASLQGELSSMGGKIMKTFALIAFAAFISSLGEVECSPAIGTGYDQLGICIENCAQCKKMLGPWFEGQLCADSCIKFKGKLIPDCEDLGSISPFLNKL